MMELYKKKGVNPLGGCLPVLLQMPIFIGLYAALSLAVELRHAHFAGWIDDLSAPEKLMLSSTFGIPVMVILFVISMMVQQWTTPTTMDPAQKKVMMVMPVVMGFMFASFPAGLTLYWLTSNLISIGQQNAMHSSDKHGKSPLAITLSVSAAVFALAFVASLF
jgi:YidC/Oxa1 family membrane protein insertase